MVRYRAENRYFLIYDKTGSSETVLNYFHVIYQSISCIEQLFFCFPSDFITYQLDFSVF